MPFGIRTELDFDRIRDGGSECGNGEKLQK
jgi:hypothetical protein